MVRVIGTALLEIRLNLLSPSPWVMGLVLGTLGYLTVRTATDASSFRLAWALSHEHGPLTGLILLFLAAGFAHRPQRYEMTELQDSKVVSSEEIIFGRWLGMVVAVLVPLGIQYGVTMAGQKFHSEFPVEPLAYAQSLGRLLPSVLFLTTLSYCLVTLTRVLVLGAGLAGLLWFILYFGATYYGSVFRVELSQNRMVFLGLTASALSLMLLGYRGQRRAKRARTTYGLALLTGLLFTVTFLHAAWATLAVPGKAHAQAAVKRLQRPGTSRQLTPALREGDPAPNFAWLDARNRRISLAGLRGKPTLLVFVQPTDAGLAPLLKRLSTLRGEFAKEELQVVAICLSEDLYAIRDAARLAGADLPVVTDWGKPLAGSYDLKQPASVLSWALDVKQTPSGMLLDEGGKKVARGISVAETGWDEMKENLGARLRGEEPEQAPGPAQAIQGMMQ